ncbi:GNAT family N-acetyltransferase [Actinoplanes rectilineatus]|uniref:GNAT family N-acetyltransferase n=1 Tax=Actinoplanes rectilineatus TaxID=113571 RepID=UPI0005F2F472|nr:GNAT family N-acetyltransferase [Actinoplanes rectilineatus]
MHVTKLNPHHPAFPRAAGLFDEYRTHYGEPAAPAATRSWLTEHLTAGRLTLIAAVEDDRVHGLLTSAGLPASLRLSHTVMIRDLYVAPARRRTGVAQALLAHATDEARASGALRISLQTEPDNTPARTLYAAAGFRPVEGLTTLALPLQGPL